MGNDPEVVKLVQTTLRTFYEPRYIILMDQLVRKEAWVLISQQSVFL